MAKQRLFTGTGTALVTPFTADDRVDERAFRRLIDFQIDHGVGALVVLGTTGENPTVTRDERRLLTGLAIDQAAGRVPVIIGTGTNATRESVAFSKEAAAEGADGLLVVGPYYNKPTQDGFRAHVQAIAAGCDCPILLYNVPGRTSFNILPQTVLTLAEEVPSVVGVKEASGNLAQVGDLLKHRPGGFGVYAGDDELTLPMVALGADGVVSVIANALPQRFSDLVRAALDGDFDRARRHHLRLLDAMRACFIETNPIPVKAVLAAMGMMEEHLRLPLVPLTEAARGEVMEAFNELVDLTAVGAA